jgi:hypothetical protein
LAQLGAGRFDQQAIGNSQLGEVEKCAPVARVSVKAE